MFRVTFGLTFIAVFWIIVLCYSRNVYAKETNCCSKASGSCKRACEQLTIITTTADSDVRDQRLLDARNFCSPSLVSFWKCMNETLQELSRAEQWSGSVCCSLAQSEKCQQACVTAIARDDLTSYCRHSDELTFFNCLERQQMGEECCGTARSTECHNACKTVFRSELTPSLEARTNLTVACNDSSPRVISCANNSFKIATVTNPHKYLHCCEKASNNECKETCRWSLKKKSTDQEIIDSLQEGGCGPPGLHDTLWQCFLMGGDTASKALEVSRIEIMGIDSAKLQCCFKATSNMCKRLCLKTFSNEWADYWEEFDKNCLSQMSEDNLIQCIDEVVEPCELGCEGLSYCTNFNNRPTELFRSCKLQSDEAARFDVELWQQQGYLSLPGLKLPVHNISQCSPQSWKAVACTLQIKPCHRHSHTNRICRDDCIELLSQCMDWSQIPPGYTAQNLCARLSPDKPSTPCIPIAPFLYPSDHPYHPPRDQVTQPCKGDPCNSSQVCAINRNCHHGRTCQPYQCVQGCKLGEASHYTVPSGSFVRIPLSTGKGCLKICQCSPEGNIEPCQPMPCFPLDSCWLGSKKIDHGSWFYMECNLCSCYAGEISCTKKQCEISSLGVKDSAYTSLPCNCPPHHVPVCGRNGNTYPNSCLAKCAGLADAEFDFGSCESKDPCAAKPCEEGQICIASRRVCLSFLHKTCPQFTCVNIKDSCRDLPYEPVCDTNGHEHSHVCYLLQYGKTLDYHGPCLFGCNKTGPVCGIDGNTYKSECSAISKRVSVDYFGMCTAVGLIGDQPRPQCDTVKCPQLSRPGCVGITPPSACCPVCTGAIRIIYSQKQIDRALYVLRGSSMRALTVNAVLMALERHVQVAECSVLGYLTVELDIVVLVMPVSQHASDLQLESCVREAEKLASMIQMGSPRISSELVLSALTAARVIHSVVSSAVVLRSFISIRYLMVPSLFLLLRWNYFCR